MERTESLLNDVFKKSWGLFSKDYVALILGTLIAIVGSVFVVTIAPLFY